MKKEMSRGVLIATLLAAIISLMPIFTVVTANTGGSLFVTDLLAGQTVDVGDVSVWNDANNLFIRYSTTDDWWMSETHLAAAASCDGIPQKNGNPIPGMFPYSAYHDPPVQTYTYQIPLVWSSGTQLCIAAQAEVQEETAWGDGDSFPGSNWATHFTYVVQGYPNLVGDWLLDFYWIEANSHWLHDMAIDTQVDGSFSGMGGYPNWGPPYTFTWPLVGTISPDLVSVTMTLTYNEVPTYQVWLTGTILPDGSMSGTAVNQDGTQHFTWTAVPVP